MSEGEKKPLYPHRTAFAREGLVVEGKTRGEKDADILVKLTIFMLGFALGALTELLL